LQSYEELLLQDLKMTAELIRQKTQSRNNMITHLFDARSTTKMTVENIAEAAGVSRKHVYTIVNKEGNDGEV
jgi:DNA-binding phage protein